MSEQPTPTAGTGPADPTTIWQDAVRTLTAAVRLTRPDGSPADFADFLASALAAVAANVGGTDRVIAGRSGSWEADLVQQLVCGTVGWDNADLAGYRTEPVELHLNVARLVDDTALDRQRASSPYQDALDAAYESFLNLPDDEYDVDSEQSEFDAVHAAWAARYAAYAQAFTAAVTAEAATVAGLAVPVTVQAITDPDADYGDGPAHPDAIEDFDPMIWRLWRAGIAAATVPGFEDERS